MFSMSPEPIEPEALKRNLSDDGAGACVIFEGWVRNTNEGKSVLKLEYEGYEALAKKEGMKILDEVKEKFELKAAHCVHRVGHLEIGELAVWVGVSSGHRGEAFDACRFVIEEVKHRLPIWKKEHYVEGDSGWVNCEIEAGQGREK